MKHPALTRQLLTLIVTALPAMVQAMDPPTNTSRDEAELGFSHDVLDKTYNDWNSHYFDLSHRLGDRNLVYGEVRDTERFNLHDREISGGYYFPLDATWTGLIEASTSPDHNVLPQDSVFGQLQKSFQDGWDIQAGQRHSRYNLAPVDITVLTGERYWSNFRASYAVYMAKVDGAGMASSNVGQFSYYYADHDYVTLGYGTGRQVESLGPGLGVLTANVTSSLSLSGRYWVSPQWGLSYEAVSEHLSNLYSRKGIRLGLRRAF